MLRRHYFVTDGRSHDCADRLAADLRQAGLTAWTSQEYSRAFAALLGAELPLLFADFDVVCLERRGQGGLIGAVAARYAQSVYELGARSAATCDAAVDTLGLLARLPGVSFGTADARQSYASPVKPQRLAGLLGMETLKDIKGWVESRSARRVQLRVCLPSAAHQGYTLSVSLPLRSCPALQESNLKDGLAETEMKEQVLIEPDDRLRRYQTEMKAAVWKAWQKARRVMLQMPTGTGKTRLFVSLIRDIRQADADARILIVAHRTELIGQISRALSVHYGLEHHVLGNGNAAAGAPILLASIQMLARRIGKDARLQTFGYIIIDEAHHSLAPTYRKMLEAYPAARVLGVTATPCRLKRTSFAALYGQLVESAPMRQFLHEGYLAPYRLFTVSDRAAALSRINRLTKFGADGDYRTQDLKEIIDTDAETEQLYDCYRLHAAGKKGIVYAVSRAHAARIAALFRHKGVAAAAIDCDTPQEERQALIARFKEKGGGVDVLVNVELFTEGFDCPGIGFVMLARPTRSLALYLQQVGRALRPTPGGGEVVILDCAGLYNRFGLPERRRDWQAHFAGIRPQGEDYVRRPLGSPAVGGLMQEVERRQKQVADTGGDTCVCRPATGLAPAVPLYGTPRQILPGILRLPALAPGTSDLLIIEGEFHPLQGTAHIDGGDYLKTATGLLIAPGGTVYRPLRPAFPLFYTTAPGGVTLHDGHLRLLFRATRMEIFPTHCLLHRYQLPPLHIDYLDYICRGMEEKVEYYIKPEYGKNREHIAQMEKNALNGVYVGV